MEDNDEFEKIVQDFYEELLKNQVDLEPEINQLVSDNFWDLIVNQ